LHNKAKEYKTVKQEKKITKKTARITLAVELFMFKN